MKQRKTYRNITDTCVCIIYYSTNRILKFNGWIKFQNVLEKCKTENTFLKLPRKQKHGEITVLKREERV